MYLHPCNQKMPEDPFLRTHEDETYFALYEQYEPEETWDEYEERMRDD